MITLKNILTALRTTVAEPDYFQTTYQRNITVSDSNFVTTKGIYARASMGQFGNFDAITIKYIYGIK